MSYSYYVIDAFTDTVFKGNPAGIVVLDEWIDDSLMQQIATENNLSETAFFAPSTEEDIDFDIVYFTPTTEIDLCGHATLGSSALLYQKLGWSKDILTFKTRKKGVLYISCNDDKITMDFPKYNHIPVPITEKMEKAIGYKVITALKANHLILRLERAAYIIDYQPDFAALSKLDPVGVVLTAKADDDKADYDFTSRVFVPNEGINEDPVTGVAHAELFPYWSQVLKKDKMFAFQSSKRGGHLEGEISEDDRILISGYGQIYLEGKIL